MSNEENENEQEMASPQPAEDGVSLQDSLESETTSRELEDTNNLPQSVSDLGMILDIPVTLSLELGSTEINIGELMHLNKGSIVELEKEASEPLEVKVNGTLVAYAEVVVINDKYGIRLLDVISESERLKKLA
ncbi:MULTISPECIES: flagellar motor switch protein FliN [unclassified Endozoicomonas]|uniref:flagellar motor switch protein FliN n=1 Tax=unclassified Endozoicomonas TaxID=2644528 RepID=UPI002148A2D6|nr:MULTISPECIES: flagellar motor switch protein FliN [unclassified Endozoicomonas]